MGLISTALGFIPLPTDSWAAKAKKVIKVGVTAYTTTRLVDEKFLHVTDRISKKGAEFHPASKSLIDKVDKVQNFYNQYNTEDKLLDKGKSLISRAFDKLTKPSGGKPPVVTPTITKVTAGQPANTPAHSTPFPPAAKGSGVKLPAAHKLHHVKFGKSLPMKPYTQKLAGVQAFAGRPKYSLGAGLSLNLKAPATKFNVLTSPAFTITQQKGFSATTSPALKIATKTGPAFKAAIKTAPIKIATRSTAIKSAMTIRPKAATARPMKIGTSAFKAPAASIASRRTAFKTAAPIRVAPRPVSMPKPMMRTGRFR